MNLRNLRARIARLAEAPKARPAPANDGPVSDGPTWPEVIERALSQELFRQVRALAEAATGLPGLTTTNAWHFVEEDFELLDRAGRLDRGLFDEMIRLGRVLEDENGVLVVRQADGRLSQADIKLVRAAQRKGLPCFALPFVAPFEPMGIDVKAEMMAVAQGIAA